MRLLECGAAFVAAATFASRHFRTGTTTTRRRQIFDPRSFLFTD
jgi:hypothetical protein